MIVLSVYCLVTVVNGQELLMSGTVQYRLVHVDMYKVDLVIRNTSM